MKVLLWKKEFFMYLKYRSIQRSRNNHRSTTPISSLNTFGGPPLCVEALGPVADGPIWWCFSPLLFPCSPLVPQPPSSFRHDSCDCFWALLPSLLSVSNAVFYPEVLCLKQVSAPVPSRSSPWPHVAYLMAAIFTPLFCLEVTENSDCTIDFAKNLGTHMVLSASFIPPTLFNQDLNLLKLCNSESQLVDCKRKRFHDLNFVRIIFKSKYIYKWFYMKY